VDVFIHQLVSSRLKALKREREEKEAVQMISFGFKRESALVIDNKD